jgi:hypothetical protein
MGVCVVCSVGYVCMYLCMCAFMYVCIYVCTYVCTYVCRLASSWDIRLRLAAARVLFVLIENNIGSRSVIARVTACLMGADRSL